LGDGSIAQPVHFLFSWARASPPPSDHLDLCRAMSGIASAI